MELRDIRYFVVVAEHQNISRAAEALELSIPALSKSLRRLEDSVGAKLVQRSSKGVVLTAVGTALLQRIGLLQGMLHDVRQEAADLARGRAGHLNIGAASGSAEHILARACVTLSNETPAVTFGLSMQTGSQQLGALRKGELDFSIGSFFSFPTSEFDHERLSDDHFVVFASAKHRLAGRKQVSLVDLVGERWATTNNTLRPQWQSLFRVFEDKELPTPSISLNTNSQAIRMAAIAYSNYLGLSSRYYLYHEARNYPLVELPVRELCFIRHISVIYRKGAYLSPAAKRLIQILKDQASISSEEKHGTRVSLAGRRVSDKAVRQ